MCPRTDKPLGAIRWKWINEIERETGIVWSKDVLRHSCASYSAKFQDVGCVSMIKYLLKHADDALLARVRAGWLSDAWDECFSVAAWQP